VQIGSPRIRTRSAAAIVGRGACAIKLCLDNECAEPRKLDSVCARRAARQQFEYHFDAHLPVAFVDRPAVADAEMVKDSVHARAPVARNVEGLEGRHRLPSRETFLALYLSQRSFRPASVPPGEMGAHKWAAIAGGARGAVSSGDADWQDRRRRQRGIVTVD
jgi:hypothetical protein